MSLFAAIWGVLAAIRAMRTEEDTGRHELVLARPGQPSPDVSLLALAAIGAGRADPLARHVRRARAHPASRGGSAFLALAVVSPVPVFVGVGALASQIAPNRRLALAISFGVLAVAFAAARGRRHRHQRRLAALGDSARLGRGVAAVRGCAAGGDPAPAADRALLLLALAMPIALRRDIGAGLLHTTDAAEPRLLLLSSPTALALRGELGVLVGWFVGLGAFALIAGIISDCFSSGLSSKLRGDIAKLGGGSLLTPSGALSFYFLFFVLVISLFASAQIVAARREEADERLETLFA